MLKTKDLRGETKEELQAMVLQLAEEIFELKNELKLNRKLEKPHLLQQKKKDRARILTIISEKRGS